MTTTTAPTASENAKQSWDAFLTTLAGLASTWAAYGLKIGKIALEQSAAALGKTAQTLETLAVELEKRASQAPKADVVVDAAAPVPGDAAPAA